MSRQAPLALLTAALLGGCAAPPSTVMSHDHGDMPPGMMHNMAMPPMPQVYMGQADKAGAPVFKNLGTHHHKITTDVAETQAYFDQGLRLLVNFNHAEAIRSFREAARLDPECAMCWWGVAFALGPNINLPMQDDAYAPAWEALGKARALAPKAAAEEQAWIAALATRYAPDATTPRPPLDAAFAEAMGKLAAKYPDDLDVAQFYAEAMMDTQPWDYWEADGTTPKGHGAEIVRVLEGILAREPNHAGALHLYIHAVEASTTPERAEAAADRLATLMPDAGHIVHMPSHIYYRVGRYRDAAAANEKAALVDETYIAACKAQGFYPLGYYGHNIHFLWTSAEMDGRYETAITAARRLVKAVDAVNVARQIGQSELFVFTPLVTYVRFGKWDEVLAEPLPPVDLALDTVVAHYARAFAYANTGDQAGAKRERDLLAGLQKAPGLAKLQSQTVPAPAMAELALLLVDGEIARTKGDLATAIRIFQQASAHERALPYTEPPYWHQPVSHLLGAVLLEAHRYVDAEAVYRDSLKVYRRDGWALRGLTLALEGQGKTREAAKVAADQRAAWQLADVVLVSSRF
ncbi:MAG: hypothetical protein IT548_14405 [Alphaproteobacteria bacterium]|nr:hypothetical protein [Alphaproteobacteria bacterium]